MYTKLKDGIRLYFHYIAISLRSTMQYKVSFFLMVTGRFLVSFNGILGVYFMLSRFGHVKGYTFGEVLLCFSIIQMDFALAECIGGGVCCVFRYCAAGRVRSYPAAAAQRGTAGAGQQVPY